MKEIIYNHLINSNKEEFINTIKKMNRTIILGECNRIFKWSDLDDFIVNFGFIKLDNMNNSYCFKLDNVNFIVIFEEGESNEFFVFISQIILCYDYFWLENENDIDSTKSTLICNVWFNELQLLTLRTIYKDGSLIKTLSYRNNKCEHIDYHNQ